MPFSPDITLGNDYLTPFYADQVLPKKIREKKADWDAAVKQGVQTSRSRLGHLSGPYFDARPAAEAADPEHPAGHLALCRIVAKGLGYPVDPDAEELPVATYQAGGAHIDLPALAHLTTPKGDPYAVVVPAAPPADGGIISDPAFLIDSTTPLAVEATKHDDPDAAVDGTDTAVGLASTLFHPDEALRWIVVVGGGSVAVIDRAHWTDGKWLGVNLDDALGTADTTPGGAYDQITYLFSHDAIAGDEILIDTAVEGSRKEAVGVSEQLRDAVREGVQLLANEVIRDRKDRRKLRTIKETEDDKEGIDPQDLARQCIRWMYRLVVLLYAEARPSIGILPTRHPIYEAGYSMDRLRRLALVDLRTEEAMHNRHFDLSLRLLFDKVNNGHRPPAQATLTMLDDGEDALAWTGMEFDALRSKLFGSDSCPDIDAAHLRDQVLQEIIKGLTAVHTKRGYEQVSYANLEINQLGAVYEGLMAYTGMFAREPMYEVTGKNSDGSKGSWLVPVADAEGYDPEVILHRRLDTGEEVPVVHEEGAFVFRLAGRDRKRSASFYTPSVLTEFTVRHALDEWQIANPDATAADILNMTVLEPALGSGAFANEAIDQLANVYLAKRQEETGQTVPPEDRELEVRKLRAHFAVNQTYGVDLNDTAVELAEVGLWLNAMHPGLRAPSLAARLRRGNSLIGARRATYTAAQVQKQPWKGTFKSPAVAPEYQHPAEVPFGTAHGGILHFLLPGEGWGAAAKTGKTIVRELAVDWAETVWDWKKQVHKKLTKAQIERARALTGVVEQLWARAAKDVAAHMASHDRTIDVWNQPTSTRRTPGPKATGYSDPNGAYRRLTTIMDAWCALWMWAPANGTDLPTVDAWLDMVEYLVGSPGNHADGTLFSEAQEDDTTARFGKGAIADAHGIWPWLDGCEQIAEAQGFFHWDLDFAPAIAAGGFDLQVGNPPWVRPEWEEADVLSEVDAWWGVTNLKSKAKSEVRQRRTHLLEGSGAGALVVNEAAETSGLSEFLGALSCYSELEGLRTNLYMNFMVRLFSTGSTLGASGLLHPETHFVDPKGGPLRREVYPRLRRHYHFTNGEFLFVDLSDRLEFGVHVYGSQRKGEASFVQCCNVVAPSTIDASLAHDGTGDVPRIKWENGKWDTRGHLARIVNVNSGVLDDWVKVFDPPGTSRLESRLLRPHTIQELGALTAFAQQPRRLNDVPNFWTVGFDEGKFKEDGTASWNIGIAESLDRVVLQGPHILNGTPFGQLPRPVVNSNNDWDPIDLESMGHGFIPRTIYRVDVDDQEFKRRQRHWNGHPFSTYVREVHREYVEIKSARTLQAVVLPSGPAHVGANVSIALPSILDTVVWAGLMSSLPYDYLIKVFGYKHIKKTVTGRLPWPELSEEIADEFRHRVLRLNCLTEHYSGIWRECYSGQWGQRIHSLGAEFLHSVGQVWQPSTPARLSRDRWGLSCDLDALAAVALGVPEDGLIQMYRSQFPVLAKNESSTLFDSLGRQVGHYHHAWDAKQRSFEDALKESNKQARRGKQQDKLWDRVVAWCDGDRSVDLAYLRPPFRRADRELAMRTAFRHFAPLAGREDLMGTEPLPEWEVWE